MTVLRYCYRSCKERLRKTENSEATGLTVQHFNTGPRDCEAGMQHDIYCRHVLSK